MPSRDASKPLKLWIAFLLVLALCAVGAAQATVSGNSAITGRVTDPSGAAVPGASVRVVSLSTRVAVVLKTNSTGRYLTPPLSPGEYTIAVKARGFRRTVQNNVRLQLGAREEVNIHLLVGAAKQTVTVSSAPPLLNTTTPQQATVVESKDVQNLPLLNRTAGQLIGLTPGIDFSYVDNGSYGAPRFRAGATGDMNAYVDGIPVNGARTNVNQMELNPPAESVQEVRVVSGLSNASTGMTEGGAVYMVTKSGTDHYHGSLYYYMRNTVLDSTNFWTHTRAPDHWWLGGGSIGGPILPRLFQHRLFFYFNLEGDKETNPTGGSLTLPTMAERQGNFQGLPPIYDPATTKEIAPNLYTRQQFSCNGQLNVICPNRLDPVMQKLIADLPTIPASITNPANDYTASWSNIATDIRWLGHVDWALSNTDTLHFETIYLRGNTGTTSLPGFRGGVDPIGGRYYPEMSSAYAISETHVFSPTVINNFNFAYRPRWWRPQATAGLNSAGNYDQALGISGYVPGEDSVFPGFGFSGYSGLGGYFNYAQNLSSLDVSDNLSWIHGNHSFEFGVQGEEARPGVMADVNPTGSFSFDPAATALPPTALGQPTTGGDAFASGLLGFVGSGSLYSGGALSFREWYWAPYFMDSWQVAPHFTLSYGLRWDIDLPLRETFYGTNFGGSGVPAGSGFNPTAINPVCNCAGTLTFAGLNGTPVGFWNTDWDRLMPEAGFAWAPPQFHNRLAIRGGFSMASISPQLGTNAGAPALGFNLANVGFSTPAEATASQPIFYLSQGFPPYQLGGNPAKLTPGFGAAAPGQNPFTGVSYVPRNWQFGYVEDLGLSVDYQLPGHLMVGVRGQGVLGRKLPFGYSLNQLPPQYWAMQGNLTQDLPFPQYAGVTNMKYPEGTIDWYGVTLEATKHYSNGLSLLASWQLAKGVGIMGCESNYMCGLSRSEGVYYSSDNFSGSSPYQRINTSFVYNLPFGPGEAFAQSGWASHLLGHWAFSSIITWDSGIPFGVGDNQGTLNCFCGLGGRLNEVGNPNAAPHTLQEWFNPNAFARPAYGKIGNVGGMILQGPATFAWNADLLKNIHLGEDRSLKISAEAFNLTNTAQWGLPNTTFGTPGFGSITGPLITGLAGAGAAAAIAARLIQVGVHFYF